VLAGGATRERIHAGQRQAAPLPAGSWVVAGAIATS